MNGENPNAVIYRLEAVLNGLDGHLRPEAIEGLAETRQLVSRMGLIATSRALVRGEANDAVLTDLVDGHVSKSRGRLALSQALPNLISQLEVRPSSTIVVEGNPSGIIVAKNAGCLVIGVQHWGRGYAGVDKLVTSGNDFMSEINEAVSELIGSEQRQ